MKKLIWGIIANIYIVFAVILIMLNDLFNWFYKKLKSYGRK